MLRATGLPQGVSADIASWAIPFIGAPSGTMGNNGAVTWGTALPNAYTNGAWVLMPAASIATGVPAATAWLWYVGTDTTHGTFFNSTYASGVPGLGVQTAFATTGPGAFVAVIAETSGPIITVPANALGPNGKITHQEQGRFTNSAGLKTYKVKYSGASGTAVYSLATASGTDAANLGYIQNRGVTNAQVAGNDPTYVAESAGTTFPAVDTTAATTLVWSFARNTVTDVQVLERAFAAVEFGA
jgi:hypothetical protein